MSGAVCGLGRPEKRWDAKIVGLMGSRPQLKVTMYGFKVVMIA